MAKPQVLPVYVDVEVEVAEGLLTSQCDHGSDAADHWSSAASQCHDQRSSSIDQWSALFDMYTRSVCPADIAAITGYHG